MAVLSPHAIARKSPKILASCSHSRPQQAYLCPRLGCCGATCSEVAQGAYFPPLMPIMCQMCNTKAALHI
eukprot:8944196-Pyramimonas_sp.AAC.1